MLFLTEPADFHPEFFVVGCFCEYNGKILLLQRQDHTRQPGQWGLVGGGKDDHESTEESVKREIFEETGMAIQAEKITLRFKTYIKYPEYDYVYYIFKTILDDAPEIKLNKQEHKNYKWLTPENALLLQDQMEDLDDCIKLCYGFD